MTLDSLKLRKLKKYVPSHKNYLKGIQHISSVTNNAVTNVWLIHIWRTDLLINENTEISSHERFKSDSKYKGGNCRRDNVISKFYK